MIPPQAQQLFCGCGRVATIFGNDRGELVLTSNGAGGLEWSDLAKVQICRTCWELEKEAAEYLNENPGFTGFG